jgi:YggT family protein
VTPGIVSTVWAGLVNLYALAIFVYVIMSWFRSTGVIFQIYRALASVCEPYIGLFRRFLPVTAGLDFSPIVAYFVLQFLIRPLVGAILLRLGL